MGLGLPELYAEAENLQGLFTVKLTESNETASL